MLKYNFYTDRYWINLYELIVALDIKSLGGAIAERGYYQYGLSSFAYDTQYSWSTHGYSYIPMLEKSTFSHGGTAGQQWQFDADADEIFKNILRRFKHEYVFSLKEKIYGEDEWSDTPNNTNFSSPDITMSRLPLDPLTPEGKLEFYNQAREFSTKLLEILNNTYERYHAILSNLRTNKDDLLAKVEAITRFNDTPQDSGEFSDDEHTTHITTSKNDYDTLMGRIAEIDTKLRNLLKDWSDEFEPLFIHEESL